MPIEPDRPDSGSQSDISLFVAAQGGASQAANELRSRHNHALRAVAVGYRTDRVSIEMIVDRAFDNLSDVGSVVSNGAVVLALFSLLREAASQLSDGSDASQLRGLVDLTVYGQTHISDAHRREQLLRAFGSLGARDQALLWFATFEGMTPSALAGRIPIGSTDMAVTSAHRARSRLRAAYGNLRCASPELPADCRTIGRNLASLSDGSLHGRAVNEATTQHVESCDTCRELLGELDEINGLLLGAGAPLVRSAGDVLTLDGAASPAATATASTRHLGVLSGVFGPQAYDRLAWRRPATLIAGALGAIIIVGLVAFGLTRNSSGSHPSQNAIVAGPVDHRSTTVPPNLGIAANTAVTSSTSPVLTHPTKGATDKTSPSTTTHAKAPAHTGGPSSLTGPGTSGSGRPGTTQRSSGSATTVPATGPTTTTAPSPTADFALSFDKGPDPIPLSVTVVNNGPQTAPDTTVTITFTDPSGYVDPNLVPAGSSCSVSPGSPLVTTCTLSAIAPKANWTIQIYPASGSVTASVPLWAGNPNSTTWPPPSP